MDAKAKQNELESLENLYPFVNLNHEKYVYWVRELFSFSKTFRLVLLVFTSQCAN